MRATLPLLPYRISQKAGEVSNIIPFKHREITLIGCTCPRCGAVQNLGTHDMAHRARCIYCGSMVKIEDTHPLGFLPKEAFDEWKRQQWEN